MRKHNKKVLEKITMDRKIVEGLRDGRSLTSLTKSTGKGKGYIIKIRDLAIEYGYLVEGEVAKTYRATNKQLPLFPEALFPLYDGRSEKAASTDDVLNPHGEWIKDRLELGWSPQTIFDEIAVSIPRSNFYRYLHRQGLMASASAYHTIELIHSPGECLQVDWGKLFDVKDVSTGKKKPFGYLSEFWVTVGMRWREWLRSLILKRPLRSSRACLRS